MKNRALVVAALAMLAAGPAAAGPGPSRDDVGWRIRREALEHSRIMKTLHVLTDVYGPRLTGSPNLKQAGDWAAAEMSDVQQAAIVVATVVYALATRDEALPRFAPDAMPKPEPETPPAPAATATGKPNTLTAEEKAAGWRLLFDGTTFAGWRGYMKPDALGMRWVIEDGCMGLPARDGADTHGERDLITTDTFGDFDLRFQWKVEAGSNSGVKYFVNEDHPEAIGHEYQIIDDLRHPDAKVSTERQTASFYDVRSATSHPTRQVGEWNDSRILVHGDHVEHWLNGQKVLEYELGTPETLAAVQDSKFRDVAGFGTKKRGHILLQDHGDAVCYRSIRIKGE